MAPTVYTQPHANLFHNVHWGVNNTISPGNVHSGTLSLRKNIVSVRQTWVCFLSPPPRASCPWASYLDSGSFCFLVSTIGMLLLLLLHWVSLFCRKKCESSLISTDSWQITAARHGYNRGQDRYLFWGAGPAKDSGKLAGNLVRRAWDRKLGGSMST